MWGRRKDIFTNHDLLTLLNDKAVYRTAPATPGLLKIKIGIGATIQTRRENQWLPHAEFFLNDLKRPLFCMWKKPKQTAFRIYKKRMSIYFDFFYQIFF